MSAKEAVMEMLKEMPEEASFDDIMHEVYVQMQIELGLQEVREGKVLEHEEVKRRLSKWLD
jgi:predicted transcriptional regulator